MFLALKRLLFPPDHKLEIHLQRLKEWLQTMFSGSHWVIIFTVLTYFGLWSVIFSQKWAEAMRPEDSVSSYATGRVSLRINIKRMMFGRKEAEGRAHGCGGGMCYQRHPVQDYTLSLGRDNARSGRRAARRASPDRQQCLHTRAPHISHETMRSCSRNPTRFPAQFFSRCASQPRWVKGPYIHEINPLGTTPPQKKKDFGSV